ncbi:rhodanese-like domain-containing protein [Buchananella felis]|uniref:rhodanese-like domain-containing protein n=1 Tax=Buchananella felis TaxID=3231492 RepID=UPI003528D191
MTTKPMRALAAAAAIVAATALAGCSSNEAAPASRPAEAASAPAAGQEASAGQEVAAEAVLIDVRTPEEFAAGHLEGAINIDVNSADFATKIGELDPAGTYLVYCRSGNRSGQAVEQMKGMGFQNVTNAGGFQQASADLGLPIVTD